MSNYYAQIDNSGLIVGTSMLANNVNSPNLIPISGIEFYSLRVNYDKNNVGLFHPKWDGNAWIEGLTQSEIDQIKNAAPSIIANDEIMQLKSDVQTMQETINFLLGL